MSKFGGVVNKGKVFRMGVRIKNLGERMGHIKVMGVRVFGWCCGAVIQLGLFIKDSVKNCSICEL